MVLCECDVLYTRRAYAPDFTEQGHHAHANCHLRDMLSVLTDMMMKHDRHAQRHTVDNMCILET